MTWERPTEAALRALLRAARERVFIVSPFISTAGVRLLAEETPGDVEVEVWTRLTVQDWLFQYSDPVALYALLRDGMRAGTARLSAGARLHAKAYVVDDRRGFGGSANLTSAALSGNVEIWSSADVPSLLATLETYRGELAEISEPRLAEWVEALGRLESLRTRVNEDLSRETEDLPVLEPVQPIIGIDDFIDWCVAREGFDHTAERALDFAWNRRGEQTQGHIKQAYYAAQLFLSEYPEHRDELLRHPGGEPFEIQESPIFDDWVAFLDQYRDYEDEDIGYRTRILMSYLTPVLGGIRLGGGGGDYKVKIALPLVARFLTERG